MGSSLSKGKNGRQNYVCIGIWAEDFLMRLLGKRKRYIHGKRLQKTWNGIIFELVGSIEKAINKNVSSDGRHKFMLNHYIKQLKKACEPDSGNPPDIVLPLVGIIFELLGMTPDYSQRSRINRKSDYDLSMCRSVIYLQDSYQKMYTILEASKSKPFYDCHRYDDIQEIYVSKFNGDPDGFINWYKGEYPELYLKLF